MKRGTAITRRCRPSANSRRRPEGESRVRAAKGALCSAFGAERKPLAFHVVLAAGNRVRRAVGLLARVGRALYVDGGERA